MFELGGPGGPGRKAGSRNKAGAPPPDDKTDFILLTSIVSPHAQSPR